MAFIPSSDLDILQIDVTILILMAKWERVCVLKFGASMLFKQILKWLFISFLPYVFLSFTYTFACECVIVR